MCISQLLLVTYSVCMDSQGFIVFQKYFVCVHLKKYSYAHMGWHDERIKWLCNIPLHSVFYNLHVAVFGLLCFILGVLPFSTFYLTTFVEHQEMICQEKGIQDWAFIIHISTVFQFLQHICEPLRHSHDRL